MQPWNIYSSNKYFMTALKISSSKDKLIHLLETVRFIEDILKRSDQEIIKDIPDYYGLQHMLQISIEIVLDIGNHILTEVYSQSPKDYSDTIILLGRNNVIDNEFTITQESMPKFRNFLVHEYSFVDPKKVLEYAREAPAIFRKFGKYFTDFLEKNKS